MITAADVIRAREMDVLGRWKRFARDERFTKLFANTELLALSRRLFGTIEGTDALAMERIGCGNEMRFPDRSCGE